MNNKQIIENLDIKKLPDIFSLYFETAWQGGKSLRAFIFRILTQLFSKSRYEHIANVIKCPDKFDGYEYSNLNNKIKVKSGEYYVFEATINYGFTVTPLLERLQTPIHDCDNWTGSVDIQLPIINKGENNLEITWEDAIETLRQPYSVTSAVFSALDHILLINKIRRFLKYRTIFTNGVFCSMFSIENWWKYFDIKIDKEISKDYTPEEVLIFLSTNKLCDLPITLLKFQDSKIIGVYTGIYSNIDLCINEKK